jgi:uncharacterized membrane protein
MKLRQHQRMVVCWLLAAFYIGFGILHTLATDGFLPIMPGWVPLPRQVILFTGFCELLGGVGLLIPRLRWIAGVTLAIYAVCVFPANIHHAVDHVTIPGLPSSWWYHAPRLAFQPVMVWLALYAGEVVDWPFRGREAQRISGAARKR